MAGWELEGMFNDIKDMDPLSNGVPGVGETSSIASSARGVPASSIALADPTKEPVPFAFEVVIVKVLSGIGLASSSASSRGCTV